MNTALQSVFVYAISLPTMLKPYKVNTGVQSVFLGTNPKRTMVSNQSSNYAKTLKVNTALQSVFLGTKPKHTVVCNQSSNYAKTLKVNTALQSVFLGTKPKRTVVCNQSANYAKTLKGKYTAEISLPLVRTLNGRRYAISLPLC